MSTSHHDDQPVDLDQLRKLGYETKDIDVPAIRSSLIWFFIGTIASVVLCIGFYIWIVPAKWNPIPEPERKFPLPSPMLQTQSEAREDIANLRAKENAILTTYGMDEGRVRIPVERAMEIVAEKGVPYGPGTNASNGGGN